MGYLLIALGAGIAAFNPFLFSFFSEAVDLSIESLRICFARAEAQNSLIPAQYLSPGPWWFPSVLIQKG